MNNDWHEKGELPPVGTECLAAFLPNEVMGKDEIVDDGHCLIRGYNDGMVWLQWREGDNFVNRVDNFEFRPLRTETDKLFEQASEIVPQHTNEVAESARKYTIETLIENGYRKIEQMSEDEFTTHSRKQLTEQFSPMQLAKLYHAGCRFLDQGE